MLHKGKNIKSWKSTDGKVANATGRFRSVSREDKPVRPASFVSLTSQLTKKMLFSWKFPVEVCKWNNENQISIYTLSDMEALSGLENPIICLVLHFSSLCICPGLLLETDAWAASTQGWHALFVLMFLWLLTNNKLLKMVLIGFRDRDPEGQVSITPSYAGLTIKSTSNQGNQCLKQFYEHLWHFS